MRALRQLIRILVIVIIAGLPLLLLAVPALATDPPDSDPSITTIKANINLRAEGDVLIYGAYNVPYADLPDDPADETYNFRLIDTDGTTQLGAAIPFVRFDSGYNEGAFSFYFSAADNLTTDQPYIIRISQSPAYFDSPQSYDLVMPLSAWTSQTEQADNRTELTLNIIDIAQELEEAHDTELLESSAGGTVLSDPTGENYFRGVIYGIQSMAPDLFLVQVYSFEKGDRAWTTDQYDDYVERFEGTWMGTATENTSATFGFDAPSFMSLLYGAPIILGAVVISVIKFRRVDPAYLIAAVVIILLGVMGWISLGLFATIYQLMAIYTGYLLFYARSS